MRTQDINWRTCLEWWMIGTNGERDKESRYLLYVPPTGRVWHKAIFRRILVQGRSPDTPSDSKNAMDSVRRLRHQVINLAIPRRVSAWRDGPLRFEDAGQSAPWLSTSQTKTHPFRTVYRPTRPTDVCPSQAGLKS